MKTNVSVFLVAALLVVVPVTALGNWYEDFDSYAPGELPPQSDWEAWDGSPGAANFNVTADQFLSSPYSVEIDGGDDAVHQYTGYTTGLWEYTAWQYIPSSATGEAAYFILMNTYVSGTHNTPDWSVQVAFDPATDTVTDEHSAGTATLVTDDWIKIQVLIDLVADTRTVYYNGTSLGEIGWTSAAEPGGALNIGAVDLWGNNTTYPVYYDDMSLEPDPSVPTMTPTITPTMGSTETPTPVPTETPTVVETCTPTPTCPPGGAYCELNKETYYAGDTFSLMLTVCNSNPEESAMNPVFVILDVYGEYYFAPTWSTFDFYEWEIPPCSCLKEEILTFTWPDGAGQGTGLFIYCGMTDVTFSVLIGEVTICEFGWA